MFIVIKLKKIIGAFLGCITILAITFVFATDDEKGEIKLPIIMYHSILKNNSPSPKYIVTPTQLENDLIYLKENGFVTITVDDLINYVYNKKPLPEKPIMLTFDDGYYNNYYYAYPLMKKYNMKMVISVVGKFTDTFSSSDDSNPNYSHLTWEQIGEMQKSGYVEIQNHTYNMHSISAARNGCKRKKDESSDEYKKALTEDLTELQKALKEKIGTEPTAFTYPYGSVSEDSYEIIRDIGFLASFSCAEGINKITTDKDSLYMLKRFIRPSGESSERYFKRISK